MRKFSALALSIIMIFSFSACKNGDDSQNANNSSANPTISTATGPSVFDANPNANKTPSKDSSSNSTTNSSTSSSNQSSTTSSPTSSAGTTSSNTSPNVNEDEPEKPDTRLIISCWGDSLTEGMSMTGGKDYPSVLNNFIGTDEYNVLNGGDGGEDTITIMARQGAVKIFTSNEITFKKGESTVRIGDGTGNGFETKEGDVIRLTAALGREMSVNDVTIGSNKYKIILRNFNWSDRSCDVYLERSQNINKALTIKKGTEAKLASADYAKTNHCDIYLMGCNGGYGEDKNNYKALIAQYKQMIEYRGNDNYLVIIPYWTSRTFTQPFIDAFGDKAVDFRAAATSTPNLESLGIGLTSVDKDYMSASKQQVPPCLRLNNSTSDVHLNEFGYKILAEALFMRGVKLGYWS